MLFKKKAKEVVEKVNHDDEYSGYNHVDLYDSKSGNYTRFSTNFTKGNIDYIYSNIGKDAIFYLEDEDGVVCFAVNLKFYANCEFSVKEENKEEK